ncbi:FHA domain-containing protein [Actinoalloteichus spitiensis]|uniref:FHA domain-containing protein n=1 Tax=Actinoalloteichus spitiensis TaxID=252394 RepID=UPI00036E7F8F|nr:FHA domain-containing protein [Actinoalloteichus spitiensis]
MIPPLAGRAATASPADGVTRGGRDGRVADRVPRSPDAAGEQRPLGTDLVPEPGLGPPTASRPAQVGSPEASCPRCGCPRVGRFCEECGHDCEGPAGDRTDGPRPPGGLHRNWVAVVTVDPQYFAEVLAGAGAEAERLRLPVERPRRRYPLSGDRVRIGRASRSASEPPAIDLGLPPEDPGVSREHAALLRGTDGGWSVVDLDSANGTVLDSGLVLRPHVPHPIGEGTRVHLGAWTTIELRTW